MPEESRTIAATLATEILEPFIRVFRVFSLISIIILPINITIVIVIFKYAMDESSAAVMTLVCALIILAALVDIIVFRILLIRRTREAAQKFIEMFPPGTEPNMIAMGIMVEMDSAAVKVLIRAIESMDPNASADASISPMPDVTMKSGQSASVSSGDEDLIDLDKGDNSK